MMFKESMKMSIRMVALTLALVGFLSSAQATAPRVRLYQPERVVLSRLDGQPATTEQVRQAILTGSQALGWVMFTEVPGASVGLRYTKKQGHSATVRIDYDAEGYQIKYVDSVELQREGSGDSARIHPAYNIWVKNLVARIRLPGELVPASAQSLAPAASHCVPGTQPRRRLESIFGQRRSGHLAGHRVAGTCHGPRHALDPAA